MFNSLKFRLLRYLDKSRHGEGKVKLIWVSLEPILMLMRKLRRLLGKIEMLYLDVTHACNLKCISCPSCAGIRKEDELSLEEQKLVIRQAKKMGAQFVALPGSGEPFLYKDIFSLIDYIRKLGMWASIFTNGTLVNKEIADFLVKRKVYVFFKLWSLDPDTVDKMVGVKNAYKWLDYSYKYNGTIKNLRIPSGLKYLLDAGEVQNCEYLIRIEVLITRINYFTLPEVIQFCKEMDLDIWLETVVFCGQAIENYKDIELNRDEYGSLYHKLVKILGEKYFKSYRCRPCTVENSPVVFVNGEVGFCAKRHSQIGNIRSAPLNLLFSKAQKLCSRDLCFIIQRRANSRYFRTCTARRYYEARYGLPCNY